MKNCCQARREIVLSMVNWQINGKTVFWGNIIKKFFGRILKKWGGEGGILKNQGVFEKEMEWKRGFGWRKCVVLGQWRFVYATNEKGWKRIWKNVKKF